MTTPPAVPPGWYQDPSGNQGLRWWDGSAWTASTSSAGVEDSTSSVLHWVAPVGRSGLAIAAGYAGLFALVVLPAPLALVLGVLALRDIARTGKKGRGRAWFGVVAGALGSAILALGLLAA